MKRMKTRNGHSSLSKEFSTKSGRKLLKGEAVHVRPRETDQSFCFVADQHVAWPWNTFQLHFPLHFQCYCSSLCGSPSDFSTAPAPQGEDHVELRLLYAGALYYWNDLVFFKRSQWSNWHAGSFWLSPRRSTPSRSISHFYKENWRSHRN